MNSPPSSPAWTAEDPLGRGVLRILRTPVLSSVSIARATFPNRNVATSQAARPTGSPTTNEAQHRAGGRDSSGNALLPRPNDRVILRHEQRKVDVHGLRSDTEARPRAGGVRRACSREERLRRGATRVRAGAAELRAFGKEHPLPTARQPRRERNARLAASDGDRAEVHRSLLAAIAGRSTARANGE